MSTKNEGMFMDNACDMNSSSSISVALIGGGITGITLTVALLKRGINVQIFEQAPKFTEIGAGIAFSPNAKQAMRLCDPQVYEAYQRVATPSANPEKANTWFDFYDGYSKEAGPGYHPKTLHFDITRESADACHRAHFLEELLELIPPEVAHFNKRLDNITYEGESSEQEGPLILKFHDGSTSTADIVIGCDGIKSMVRHLVLDDHPQCHQPSYTHKYAYRGLVPMKDAIEAIGSDLASNRALYMGKNGHVIAFPVAHGELMNVVAFKHDPEEWTHPRLTMPSKREDAIHDFRDWGPNVKAIMNLLMDNLDRWAIFDLGDNPVPFFNKGRICIAGDAAHATGPHHGAGAGFCVEDSAILAELLLDAQQRIQKGESSASKEALLKNALAVFDSSRRERTQWLVESSRACVDLYEWRDKECGNDPVKIERELLWRNRKIWNVNLEDMAKSARKELEITLQ